MASSVKYASSVPKLQSESLHSIRVHLTSDAEVRYINSVEKLPTAGPLSRTQTINRLFGQRLAMARRVRKISQTELGRRMTRSRVSIANIESGRHGVQLSQVFALADALNASVDELIPERKAIFSFEASTEDAFVEFAKARLGDLNGMRA